MKLTKSKLYRMVRVDDPVLAHFASAWEQRYDIDPISTLLIYRRLIWFDIGCILIALLLGLFSYALSFRFVPNLPQPESVYLLPLPWSSALMVFGLSGGVMRWLGHKCFFSGFIRDYKTLAESFNQFYRSLELLCERVESFTELNDDFKRKDAAFDILFEEAQHVKALQKLPWRKKKAAKAREQISKDIASLSVLTGVVEKHDEYFSDQKIESHKRHKGLVATIAASRS